MQEGRWTTVTPSQFDHERAALDHVRRLLPDTEPYRAWSNFTFTADTGHVYEVDLLVATPSGLYLIEIKSLHGRLTSNGANWILGNQSVRTFDNPLHLADAKAKRLRSLLSAQVRRQRSDERVPFIQGAVFLSVPSLQVADPVALDIFGLGTLSYLLLSGEAPAATRAELLTRLASEDGLRPSSSVDSVSEFMDELVQAATAPVPARRLSSVAELLEMLALVEDELTAPSAEQTESIDLLEARVGDVVGEWCIVKKLGTGSTSRAFLAENTRTRAPEVLKVALSDEKAARLAHEARVLRGLHQDSRIIRLAREEPIEIAPRTMIVLEHAGEKTVARKLREDGRLTIDELETYAP